MQINSLNSNNLLYRLQSLSQNTKVVQPTVQTQSVTKKPVVMSLEAFNSLTYAGSIYQLQTQQSQTTGSTSTPLYPSQMTLEEALACIEEEGAKVDRSNMSDKEIIEEMYARYHKYVGEENFMPGLDVYTTDTMSKVSKVSDREYQVLRGMGWTTERLNNARAEMLGYGGMTQLEMRKAITDKYSADGMTPAKYLKMLDEMDLTGALDDFAGFTLAGIFKNSVYAHVDSTYGDERDIIYSSVESYMQRSVSLQDIYNDMIFRMTDGGDKPAHVQNMIHEFFKEILSY